MEPLLFCFRDEAHFHLVGTQIHRITVPLPWGPAIIVSTRGGLPKELSYQLPGGYSRATLSPGVINTET